jgi:hypothetical protein
MFSFGFWILPSTAAVPSCVYLHERDRYVRSGEQERPLLVNNCFAAYYRTRYEIQLIKGRWFFTYCDKTCHMKRCDKSKCFDTIQLLLLSLENAQEVRVPTFKNQ